MSPENTAPARAAPSPRAPRVPRLRVHRPTGQSYVFAEGRRHYLGRPGPDAEARYRRFVADLVANGGRLPPPAPDELTIAELLVEFWRHADGYYAAPDGGPGDEVANLKAALRPLSQLYADTPAAAFGPREFRACRDVLTRGALKGMKRAASRSYANACMAKVRRLFRWAVSHGLVHPDVLARLDAVEPLRRGRCPGVRETARVLPAPEKDVEAACAKLPRHLADMVRVQLLTGMRPGELCAMRAGDVERPASGCWLYRPRSHKGTYLGRVREVYLGPQARVILAPLLLACASPEEHVFSPRKTDAEVRARREAERVTPPGQGNARGTNRKRRPKVRPGDSYDGATYARAIRRACKAANVETWAPNRLRHLAATKLRALAGLDAAAAVLGHAHASHITAAVYAEAASGKAREVAEDVG